MLLHEIIFTGLFFVPYFKLRTALTKVQGWFYAAFYSKLGYYPDSQTISLQKTYGMLDAQLESVVFSSFRKEFYLR